MVRSQHVTPSFGEVCTSGNELFADATCLPWLSRNHATDRSLPGHESEVEAMKHIPLIAVLGAVLIGGCAVRTTERVVEKPVPAQTVVRADPVVVAPPATTTVYTTR